MTESFFDTWSMHFKVHIEYTCDLALNFGRAFIRDAITFLINNTVIHIEYIYSNRYKSLSY